jgi:hypothetical protein
LPPVDPGAQIIKKQKPVIVMEKYTDPNKASHPDPITKAPGYHPVGTSVGAVAGGAAAGAAVGTVAGPAGTIAGAAVGAVIGGLAGKGVAEKINPSVEDRYWRDNHERQAYAAGLGYDEFAPAYRVGYEGYGLYGFDGKTYDESEDELRRRYESWNPKISWEKARPATRAAWDRSHAQYGNGVLV